MIQYTCPKCSSTVAADNNKAGQSHTCPNCGNVNVVPQAGPPQAAAPETPRAEAEPEPGPAPGAQAEAPPGPAAPTPPPPTAPAGAMSDKDARMWAMFCHLGGLLILFQIVPFANALAPLIIWLIHKDKSPFIDDQGKEALNFQIAVSIAVVVCIPLFFVLIGILLLVAVVIANVVFAITATLKANAGERYRYPYTIRFIK
ncbi:MAG TPA: DUF4870 domain-containing protein [Phycisphaerae bacterium]|nr:DUF4870 domain-containing protein [Phycisphaerae bacterium]